MKVFSVVLAELCLETCEFVTMLQLDVQKEVITAFDPAVFATVYGPWLLLFPPAVSAAAALSFGHAGSSDGLLVAVIL